MPAFLLNCRHLAVTIKDYRNEKYRIKFVFIVLTIVLLSCNLPVSALNPNFNAIGTPAAESETIATPAGPDYSSARLTIVDLPQGFRELTAEELEALGLSSSQFTNLFTGMLSEAQPVNFAAFTNTNGSFEVIVSVLIVPLTFVERTAVDLYLHDPQRLADNFSGAGGITDLALDESAPTVGESSSSVTFGVPNAPLKMNGGLTVSRRGDAIQVALLFYPDGTVPALASHAVAQIVDEKLIVHQINHTLKSHSRSTSRGIISSLSHASHHLSPRKSPDDIDLLVGRCCCRHIGWFSRFRYLCAQGPGLRSSGIHHHGYRFRPNRLHGTI